MDNYMDRFETPEDFIRSEILANRGTNSVVTKEQLAEVAGWKSEDGRPIERLAKGKLWAMVVNQYGERAYTMFPVGVSSICFQQKFGINHKDVLKLAKAGVITCTGERKFRKYGRYCHAKVFSAFDYFRLTAEDVHMQLEQLQRETRTATTHK